MENGHVFENSHHVILKYDLVYIWDVKDYLIHVFHIQMKKLKIVIYSICSFNYTDTNNINAWYLFSACHVPGTGLRILYALTH